MNMNKWDSFFLDLAKKISTLSKDPSTKVGAVIARPDNSICSMGFNGFPKKMEDKQDWLNNRDIKYKRVIHAEKNAYIFAREQIEGYTLYTYPFMPCSPCCSFFIQAGISKIVAPYSDNPRWIEDFALTRESCLECGVELIEYLGWDRI